jgi:hypothetical protein
LIALLMAVIATLGALAAYRAAIADDDVSAKTRLLDEGQILELNRRQRYLDEIVQSAAYDEQRDALRAEAKLLKRPSAIGRERVRSEEDYAEARVLDAYAAYFNWDTGKHLEVGLERLATRELGRLGFDVVWPRDADPNKSQTVPNIWVNEQRTIADATTALSVLTGAVVLFVLSLLFLTWADLSPPRWQKPLVGVSAVPTAIALCVVAMQVNDLVTRIVAAAAVLVVGALLYLLFATKPESDEEEVELPAAEVEPRGTIVSRLHMRPIGHRFARGVTMIIAVTALLSALCGFLYTRAADEMNAASSEAVADQTMMFRESTRIRAVANDLILQASQLQQQEARLDSATQAKQLWTERVLQSPDVDLRREASLQSDLYNEMQKDAAQEARDLFSANDPDSILGDPGFPSLYIAHSTQSASDRALAMWDAANESALAYHHKMALYLAGLTLFAIALYLLGQSLGIKGILATRILLYVALAFVICGTSVTVYAWAQRAGTNSLGKSSSKEPAFPPQCQDEIISYEQGNNSDVRDVAARHYACGMVLRALAKTPGDHVKAADQLAYAMQLRPDFPFARFYHAYEMRAATSPQAGFDYSSLPSKGVVNAVVDDESKADTALEKDGFYNPVLLDNLGFQLYLRGLLNSNRSDISDGLVKIRRALTRDEAFDDDTADVHMNEALMLLALGRFDDALDIYRNLRQKSARLSAGMALGGMTDLELLAEECGRRGIPDAADCRRLQTELPVLKSLIVSATWQGAKQRAADPALAIDYVLVTPGAAAWRVHMTKPSTSPHNLVVVWYRRDPSWNVWTALPDITTANASFGSGSSDGFTASLPNDSFQNCLASGDYRAEFYLDGALVGQRTTAQPLDSYKSVFDPRLNVALCYPKSWKITQTVDGAYRYIQPPDERNGIGVFRRNIPAPVSAVDARNVLQYELGIVMSDRVVPSRDDGTCPEKNPDWHRGWYTARRRSVLAQYRLTEDGELYVGYFVAHGTQPEKEQCAIADSLVLFSGS